MATLAWHPLIASLTLDAFSSLQNQVAWHQLGVFLSLDTFNSL